MKYLCALLIAFAAFGQKPAPVVPAEMSQVRKVYLLPMTSGFDQYLTNHLVKMGRFEIVAKPELADAVFTDRLGAAFEARLDELDASQRKTAAEEAAKVEAAKPEPPKTEEDAEMKEKRAIDAKPDAWITPQAQRSNFSRGKGTIFLVDRRSRKVLWSAYERPRNTQPDTLNKTAEQVVKKLAGV